MSKSDLVDLTVTRHAETEKAILVSDDGEQDGAVWLPKSQIEINVDSGTTLQITMPEWLAIDKGLV